MAVLERRPASWDVSELLSDELCLPSYVGQGFGGGEGATAASSG